MDKKAVFLRRVRGLLITVFGIVAVASFGFFGVTAFYSESWRTKSAEALPVLTKMIPSPISAMVTGEPSLLPSLYVDGNDYCGILYFGNDELGYAIFSHWSSSPFAQRPVHFYGTPGGGNFVICGDNKTFSFVSSCEAGDRIEFTDAIGQHYAYRVTSVKHSGRVDAEYLVDTGADLTVFVQKPGNVIILLADASE